MNKMMKKVLSGLLCVTLVLSVTISNSTLSYAEDTEFENEINLMETSEELVESESFEEEPETDAENEEETETELESEMGFEADVENEVEVDDEIETEADEEIETEDEFETEIETTEVETIEIVENETIEEAEATPSEIVQDEELTVIDEATDEEIIATPSDIDDIIEETNSNIATESEINEIPEEIVATMSEVKILFKSEVATESEIPSFTINYGFKEPRILFSKAVKRSSRLLRASSLPSSYDGRNETVGGLTIVPPVRNQKPYGMCWAFSTIGMMETSIRKKGIVSNENDSDLSEAALGYFYYNLQNVYDNPANVDKPGLQGKDYNKLPASIASTWANLGGNQLSSTLFMTSYIGAVKENSDTGFSNMSNIVSSGLDGKYAFNNNSFEISNVYYINKNDRDVIKKAIMDYGSVGISYYHPGFGVGAVKVDPDTGEVYFKNASNHDGNHAVNIIGWDDSVSKDKFINNPTTDGAWIIRNSWGTNGVNTKDGYYYMSYDEPTIGSNCYAIDAISANTYKYNYHYDTTGYPAAASVGSAAGNIFKVTGNENQSLDAVNIAVNTPGANFAVKIYTKDTQMSNPEDGTLRTTKNYTCSTEGIFTIPLDDKVLLPLDTYFSVVVVSTGSLSLYVDATDTSLMEADYEGWYNENKPNTSYRKSGSSWQGTWDASNPYKEDYNCYNYRIKALTNSAVGISFDANGGTGNMQSIGGAVGDTVTIPANAFTKTGYTFASFNTAANGSGTIYNPGSSITISGATTLYAQWNPIHYTLKLNPNGQTGTATSASYAYDQDITLSNPGFTSDTHTFGGFTQNADGTGTSYTEGQVVNKLADTEGAEVTLYAKWLPGSFKVKFNANGGDGTMELQPIVIDSATPLTQNAFTRTGYTFAGWNTLADGTGTNYADKQSVTNLANKDEEFNLYAKWTPNTYTIKFSVDSAFSSVSVSPITATYDEDVTFPTFTDATMVGATFDKWKFDSATPQYFNPGVAATKPNLTSQNGGTVTVKATFTSRPFKIRFNIATPSSAGANTVGGTLPSETTFTDKINLPNASLTLSGHVLSGWSLQPNGAKVINNAATNVNAMAFLKSANVTSATFTDNMVIDVYTLFTVYIPPQPHNPTGGGGGSSGGGGGDKNVGPLADKINNEANLANTYSQSNIRPIAPRTNDIVVSVEKISWQFNPINGKWSLNLDKDLGTKAANAFVAIPSFDINGNVVNDVYNFDANGEMVLGWTNDGMGNVYYFSPNNDANIGKMQFGWKQLDNGNWYYFSNDGKLVMNGTTPDGYKVGLDGKWGA